MSDKNESQQDSEKPIILRVIDTETTGLSPKNACIIEIASIDLDLQSGALINPMSFFVKPTTPLHPKAQEVNGITEEMLVGADDLDNVLKKFDDENITRYVAHNAKFDKRFLEPHRPNWNWSCSLELAKSFEFESYSNENIYKVLYGTNELPKELVEQLGEGVSAHRALYDAMKTAMITYYMLGALHNKQKELDSEVSES